MDNEDNRQASYVSGWVGGTSVNGSGNTTFQFCKVDGAAFQSLQSSSSPRSNYAVVKMDFTCPAGAVEFSRHFDNEDSNNQNDSPLPRTSENITLDFCLFRGGGTVGTGLPDLGFEYGVFATPSFAFSAGTGQIFTDDEDTRNANGYSADPAWQADAKAIVSDGGNTYLNVARAGFPVCGDATCNGLETEWSCTSDCAMCGNGVCGPTENQGTCVHDCGYCGDGYCGAGEDAWSCSNDCGSCGDGICGPFEDPFSCGTDCGGICGDGFCGPGEDSWNCSRDCW